MRVAFFGGSFDPPHRGHLAIAEAALERLYLDRVLFAPVGRQPLKHGAAPFSYAVTSYEDRCALVDLAIAEQPAMTVSLLDAPKADGEPNYTLDTLRQLKATLAPTDELFCLIGADSFGTLRQWRNAAELLVSYNFIVASRPGFTLGDLAAALPDSLVAGLSAIEPIESGGGFQLFHVADESGRQASLYSLPDLDENISATEIRAALASGSAEQNVLLPAVIRYIESHGLYKGNPSR